MSHSLSAQADRMRFDKLFAPNDRRLALALCIIGLLLTVIGGMRLVSSIRDAGDEQLKIADTTVSQAIRPALGRPQEAAVRRAAVVLISRPASRLSYVSVRDERGQLLASVGSHDGVFAWLPAAGARSWRAWFYRTLSIRQVRSVSADGGGSQASVAFGLSWPAVLASTWRAWWFWLSLCGLGLACLLAGALGWRSPVAGPERGRADRRRADAISSRSGDTTKEDPPRRSWRARLARASAVRPPTSARAAPAQQPVANSGFQQIGAQRPASAGGSSERSVQGPDVPAHGIAQSDALDGLAPTEPASFRQSPDQAQDDASSAGAETIAPVARTAPQVFDDTTLDVRFQPIWRGSERALLAGGWVTLVWRSGDGRPVAPAVLARQAEQTGRLSAFTGWLAERVTLLQSNWHTLGFATVPIVLPLAAAWREDAEVWRIWRDELAGAGLADNDLLLQLDASIADQASGLPVRRMLSLTDIDTAPRLAADMFFLPSEHGRCGDQARELLAASHQSILLGPLTEPARQAQLLAEHARVAWFPAADDDANLYTPRAFARLVSRHALSPL